MERILPSFFFFLKARTRKRLPQRRFVLFNIRAIRLRDDIIDRATDLKRERQLHPIPEEDETSQSNIYLDVIRKKILKSLHNRSILFLLDDIKKKCLFLTLSETSIKNIFTKLETDFEATSEINSHGNYSRMEGVVESIPGEQIIEGSFSWGWPSFIYGTLYSSQGENLGKIQLRSGSTTRDVITKRHRWKSFY